MFSKYIFGRKTRRRKLLLVCKSSSMSAFSPRPRRRELIASSIANPQAHRAHEDSVRGAVPTGARPRKCCFGTRNVRCLAGWLSSVLGRFVTPHFRNKQAPTRENMKSRYNSTAACDRRWWIATIGLPHFYEKPLKQRCSMLETMINGNNCAASLLEMSKLCSRKAALNHPERWQETRHNTSRYPSSFTRTKFRIESLWKQDDRNLEQTRVGKRKDVLKCSSLCRCLEDPITSHPRFKI